jgi:transketolase
MSFALKELSRLLATDTPVVGAVVGIDSFGASAPIEALMPHFGFTVDKVVAAAQSL